MLKAKMWTCAILKHKNFTNWCIPFHFWVDSDFQFKGSFISTKKLQSHQKPITWHHTKQSTMTELHQEILSIGNNTGLGWSDVYSFWILSQMSCNSFLVFLAQTSSTKWNQGTQTILCFTFRYKQKSPLDFPSKFTQELSLWLSFVYISCIFVSSLYSPKP